MKIIANILIITRKDLKLPDNQILDQVKHLGPQSISAILQPQGWEYQEDTWRINRVLREKTVILKNHLSVIAYQGKSTFKNLNK